jgi:hypothetical protein
MTKPMPEEIELPKLPDEKTIREMALMIPCGVDRVSDDQYMDRFRDKLRETLEYVRIYHALIADLSSAREGDDDLAKIEDAMYTVLCESNGLSDNTWVVDGKVFKPEFPVTGFRKILSDLEAAWLLVQEMRKSKAALRPAPIEFQCEVCGAINNENVVISAAEGAKG